jgi:iron complex outermembrane receptor protein
LPLLLVAEEALLIVNSRRPSPRLHHGVYDVGVRGYQQPFQSRLLVLIDGRQVFLDDYSRTAWENLPVNIDDIRQIEVVKGAASALFGSNAAGGVINIITYSPIYDKNNVTNLGVGTQNSVTGDATVTTNGIWGGTKISGGGMGAREFDTARYPLDQSPSDPEHRYIVNSSVFQLTPWIQAFSEATYSESTGSVADPTDGAVVGSEKITTYSVRGGGNWQSPYGLLELDNYLNHSFIDLFEPTDGGAPYGFTTDLVDSQLKDQFKLGADHAVRLALEYKYKDFKMDGAQLAAETPAIDESNYAASGTWVWQLAPKVSWSNAARFDHLDMEETGTLIANSVNSYADYSHSINAWSANSDVVYKATDLDSFRVGFGRGVQLPSLINSGYGLYQNFGTPSSVFLSDWEGNPRLKPTTVTDYSADYTRKIPDISSDLKFSVYYEMNKDIVSPLTQIGTIMVNGVPQAYGESINVGAVMGMVVRWS